MRNLHNIASLKSGTVHAAHDNAGRTICRPNAVTEGEWVDDVTVNCGNCKRIIAEAHAEASELHAAFLLGVAQAEISAELRGGRPKGLDAMSDALLSDELLWARSELARADRLDWMTGCARRLTMLRLERDFRVAASAGR